MEALSVKNHYRPEYDLPSLLVRGSQLQTRLARRPYGYSASQVERLLDELTIELARLENQVGALRAENHELRGRLLAQLSAPTPQRLTFLEISAEEEGRSRSISARPSMPRGSESSDEVAGASSANPRD